MAASSRLKFVVENDTFLRLIQVVLDPTAPEERFQAFTHFCLHDLSDFRGWCDSIRARVPNIYPSEVHLVDDRAQLLAYMAGATVAVVEELQMGAAEVAAAGGSLRFIQKYGRTTRNIDPAACEKRGIKILTIR